MALQATFVANFTEFDKAVKAGVENLRLFDVKVKGSQGALQRMTSDFDGTRLIREATLAAAAVEKIGGASKLTEAEQKRLTATVSDAMAKYQALGVEVPADLKKISAELNNLAKQHQAAEAEAKRLADAEKRAAEQAAASQRDLQRAIQATAQAHTDMVRAFSGSKIQNEADRAVAAVREIGGVTKLTQNEQRQLNTLVTEAIAKYHALGAEAPPDLKAVASELDKTAKATNDIGDGVKKSGESMASFSGIAKSVGGVLAGAFTVQAVASFAKEVIDLGGEIADLSTRTGIGTDAIQELKFAADQTGSTLDTMTGAIEQMGNRLTEGNSGTVTAVKALGLSLEELRSLHPEDAFTEIADAIKDVPDPMRQTQLAMELFGRSGTEILPAIKAGIGELRDQAQSLGQVMSEDAVEGLDSLGDAWGNVIGAAKRDVGELIAKFVELGKAIKDATPASANTFKLPTGVNQSDQFGTAAGFAGALAEADRREQERIQKLLDDVKRPSLFGPEFARNSTGGFTPDTPSPEEQERFAKAQREAVEAALEFAKAVKTQADAWRAADITRLLKEKEAAFRSLSAEEKKNPAIIKAVVEEYGKLRQNVKASALPRDLEALYRAHLPVIDGTKQLIDVTGRYATATLPDLSRRALEAKNMLAGLTAEGVIPTSRAFGDLFDQMRVPVPEGIKNVGVDITRTYRSTLDLNDSIDDFARAWSQLAQVRPLEGWIQDVAELIQLMNIGQQAGKQFRDAFYNPQKTMTGFDAQGNAMFSGGFDFSSLTGGQGAGSAIAGWAQLAQTGVNAWSSMDQATDVMGRGNRALRGAATGASAGGAIVPGWGHLAGAVVGAIIGALRNPGFEDVFKRVAHNFGVNISEELARAIDKQKKEFGNSRQAAEIFNLDKIIQQGGGIKDSNVKPMTDALRGVFSMIETGKFTVEQARDTLDRSFAAFAEHVRKSKSLATTAFQDLFELNQRFGTQSEELRNFLEGQTGVLGGGVATLAGPLLQQSAKLKDEIDASKARLKELDEQSSKIRFGDRPFDELGVEDRRMLDESDSAWDREKAKLDELLAKQAAGAQEAAAELERLGVIAVASFNAATRGGLDMLTAVQQLGPGLDALLQIQKNLGLETQNAGLAELAHFRDLVNQNQTLVASTAALGETLRALTSIGGLTTDALAAMEQQGAQTFDRLVAAGFTENQALAQMKDFLLNVMEAHEQLGTPIDENTQKLIDQAQEMGLLKDDGKDLGKVLKDGFTQVKDAVLLVAKALGAEVPKAAEQAKRAIDNIPKKVPVEVGFTYTQLNSPDFEGGRIVRPPIEPPAGATAEEAETYTREAANRPAFATGGWGNFGSGTLAMLHGKEAIFTEPQLKGLAGVVQRQNERMAEETSIHIEFAQGAVVVHGNADADLIDRITDGIAMKIMQGGRTRTLWREAVR